MSGVQQRRSCLNKKRKRGGNVNKIEEEESRRKGYTCCWAEVSIEGTGGGIVGVDNAGVDCSRPALHMLDISSLSSSLFPLLPSHLRINLPLSSPLPSPPLLSSLLVTRQLSDCFQRGCASSLALSCQSRSLNQEVNRTKQECYESEIR